MDLSDKAVAHGEAGERTIDRLIEQRSKSFGAEEISELARQRARAEREEEADRRALRRELWRRHHARLAEVHDALAERNRVAAERLAATPNGRPVW